MARGGAASSRGRGKFKVSRGGGRHFSRDLDPRFQQPEGSESSEEETSSEEESEDENPTEAAGAKLAPEMAALNLKLGNTVAVDAPEEEEMTRAEKKALKKAQAEKAAKKVAIKEESGSESGSESEEEQVQKGKGAGKGKQPAVVQQSRKEREAAEKKAAADRYAKAHAQGKTIEAKSDLARLQEVRARREAAARQRKAEADEAAREAAEKKEKLLAKKI